MTFDPREVDVDGEREYSEFFTREKALQLQVSLNKVIIYIYYNLLV